MNVLIYFWKITNKKYVTGDMLKIRTTFLHKYLLSKKVFRGNSKNRRRRRSKVSVFSSVKRGGKRELWTLRPDAIWPETGNLGARARSLCPRFRQRKLMMGDNHLFHHLSRAVEQGTVVVALWPLSEPSDRSPGLGLRTRHRCFLSWFILSRPPPPPPFAPSERNL